VKRLRAANRTARGINQSFEKLAAKKFPQLDPGGIPEERALGMREVFTSILARGQGKLPDFLHRSFFNTNAIGS
jgi:hypothetical protein